MKEQEPSKALPSNRVLVALQAFTLVEVLVVIAIVSIIVAITVPITFSAREKARQGVCSSNLRQIGQATAMYLSDYDGTYPHAVTLWQRQHPTSIPGAEDNPSLVPFIPLIHEVLQPYCRSKQLFHCPSDFGFFPKLSSSVTPSMSEKQGSSYGFAPLVRNEHESCWQKPSELAYAYDFSGEWHSWRDADFFNLRLNALYYDGHVEFILAQNQKIGFKCWQ